MPLSCPTFRATHDMKQTPKGCPLQPGGVPVARGVGAYWLYWKVRKVISMIYRGDLPACDPSLTENASGKAAC